MLSGKIKIPKSTGTVPVKEIGYEKKDREVEFEFDSKVVWSNPKVSIKRGGKEFVRRIDETDRDGVEVKVKKLKKGKIYQYTISGVRKQGDKQDTTLTGSFRA